MTITYYNSKGYPKIKHLSKDELITMKLDWTNNFLTVSAFAQHYCISYFSAQRIAQTKIDEL